MIRNLKIHFHIFTKTMRTVIYRVTLNALCSFLVLTAGAQDTYSTTAEKLRKAIDLQFYMPEQGYYRENAEKRPDDRPVSYLWPLCALIQANREEQALHPTANLVDKTLAVIRKYYDDRPPHSGYASYPPPLGGGDRFYDDNQWIGIALMDAWFAEPRPEYLSISRSIYDFMMTASDTVGGGGLYWEEGKPTKNTCSNGPAIILSLQLYKATGEKKFLDTGISLYNWVNQHLRDTEGLYWDNITYPSGKIDRRKFSYNTGTMMQSALYLYDITSDEKYLHHAKQSAAAAREYFLSGPLFQDDLWFNAVLLRAFQHLLRHDSDPSCINAFKACVDNELKNNQQPGGLFTRKGQTLNLVNQAGMLEILNRLALIRK